MRGFLKGVLILTLACGLAASAWSDEMRIVAPYAGILANTTKIEGQPDAVDSGFLSGLFFQWIDTERYQWNAFAYFAPDVNYSSTFGGHFIYDRYFGPDRHGKFVAGLGLEALSVDMDAGNAIVPLEDLNMKTTVLIPYLRAGKYFKFSAGPADFSLLPWAGIQPQWVWGDLVIDPPGPSSATSSSLDEFVFYGIAGINLKATLFHFVDLEGKYQATFDASDYYSTFNATANLYFSRSWGLSYRFKHMTTSQGSNAFHYIGVAYIF